MIKTGFDKISNKELRIYRYYGRLSTIYKVISYVRNTEIIDVVYERSVLKIS